MHAKLKKCLLKCALSWVIQRYIGMHNNATLHCTKLYCGSLNRRYNAVGAKYRLNYNICHVPPLGFTRHNKSDRHAFLLITVMIKMATSRCSFNPPINVLTQKRNRLGFTDTNGDSFCQDADTTKRQRILSLLKFNFLNFAQYIFASFQSFIISEIQYQLITIGKFLNFFQKY